MTDKKLTDEEIIKALTELSRYTGFQKKYTQVLNATLDLINRQKSEIERLKGSTIVNNIMEIQRIKKEAKAETYKEFAERIRECCNSNNELSADAWLSVTTDINCVLKEMVGGENDKRRSDKHD